MFAVYRENEVCICEIKVFIELKLHTNTQEKTPFSFIKKFCKFELKNIYIKFFVIKYIGRANKYFGCLDDWLCCMFIFRALYILLSTFKFSCREKFVKKYENGARSFLPRFFPAGLFPLIFLR